MDSDSWENMNDLNEKINIVQNLIKNNLKIDLGDITKKDYDNLSILCESLNNIYELIIKLKSKINNLENKNKSKENFLKIEKLEKIIENKDIEVINLKNLINKNISSNIKYDLITEKDNKNEDNFKDKIIENYSDLIKNIIKQNNDLKYKEKEYINNLINLNEVINKVSNNNLNLNLYNSNFDKNNKKSEITINNLIKENKKNLLSKHFDEFMNFKNDELILNNKQLNFEINLNLDFNFNNNLYSNKLKKYKKIIEDENF